MIQNIIAVIIIIIAAVYVGRTIYLKLTRLSAPTVGTCGHRCDKCPFAKYAECSKPACSKPEKQK